MKTRILLATVSSLMFSTAAFAADVNNNGIEDGTVGTVDISDAAILEAITFGTAAITEVLQPLRDASKDTEFVDSEGKTGTMPSTGLMIKGTYEQSQANETAISENTAAINSVEGRLNAADDRITASSQAGYEYNAAVTDLKVTEARALSTFIRNTDDLNDLPDEDELQKRKDAAIAEKQAVVDTLYTDPYKNKDSITDNAAAIGDNAAAIGDNAAAIGDNTADIADHEDRITDNTDAIVVHEGLIGDNEQGILDNLGLIETVQGLTEDNKAEIEKNAAAIVSNANRINTLEEDVDSLKSGVAMAIAIANAPIVSNGNNQFSLSGGVGYYEDKFALSLKTAFMPNDSIAITASVASDLSESYAFGAGVGIGF